jgi:hypothetical protein
MRTRRHEIPLQRARAVPRGDPLPPVPVAFAMFAIFAIFANFESFKSFIRQRVAHLGGLRLDQLFG